MLSNTRESGFVPDGESVLIGDLITALTQLKLRYGNMPLVVRDFETDKEWQVWTKPVFNTDLEIDTLFAVDVTEENGRCIIGINDLEESA